MSKILSLRVFSHSKTIQDIQALRRLVRSKVNNLSVVSDSLKVEIDYWTARLCAFDKETLNLAKQIREELTGAHQTYPDLNLLIVDALIAETDGNNNEAIHLLRDHDDSDSRAALVALLVRSKGDNDALDWFEKQKNHNEPEFFKAIGWVSWAKSMVKLGKWEEAAQQLLTLDGHWSEMPVLAFMEGQINAAMLLPDDFRGMVLDSLPLYTGITPSQGADKEKYHARATACFEFASQNLLDLNDQRLIEVINNWGQWLRLMNPNMTMVHAARDEIRQLIEKGDAKAVDTIDLAYVFNIPYNVEPLRQYLEQRKGIGGLTDSELNAECLICEQVMTAHNRVVYLEQHKTRLRKIIPLPLLVTMQVTALVEDNQTDKALALITEHTDDIGEEHSIRLIATISIREGNDPRQELENLYHKEKSLAALQSLVPYLKNMGDRAACLPYARVLFDRVPNVDNALQVIWCLGDQSSFDHESILEFFNGHTDIVEQSDDLKEVKAFALFYAGRFQEAKQVNDTLLNSRDLINDRYLDINIAICSGDWEHVVTIIERAWPQRDTYEPNFLMSLAQLAGQQDKTPQRALELAQLATKKAPNDPYILASAYGLHYQLGHEDEVNPDWLNRATVLSSGDDGPLWRVDMKKIVTDLIPKRQEHLYEIENMWSGGELPTSVAVGKFNMSLAHFIFQVSAKNTLESDDRRRTILPLITGGRAPVELHNNWTIGLDITSIMVLAKLGLLKLALGTFHHVKLSPNIMELLFQEKVEARFHQPSRIEAAKQVQQLLNRSQLRVTDHQATAPPNITSEVGPELATLFQAARDNEGKVICVLPIYKAGSLMEQHADTSSHDDLIITTTDFCVLLHKAGKIDTNDYERAVQYFKSMGQTDHTILPSSDLNKTFYIDRSAIFYLQDIDMLQPIAAAGLDLRVHPDVLEEQHALIEAGDTGEELIHKIEDIRRILHGTVASGSASFLPRRDGLNEQNRNIDMQLESIGQLWGGNDAYDALCIDDRFYNRHTVLTGPTGKTVPIVCILDVLHYLLNRKHISVVEHWGFRHKLRQGGFAFIPLEADELIHWLKGSKMDNGHLKESMELRVIRQAHERFSTSGLATAEESQELSVQAQNSYGRVIPGLWQDEELTPEQAATGSEWLWHYLLMMTVLYRQHYPPDTYNNSVRKLISCYLALLFNTLLEVTEGRRDHYTGWLERSVLQPLRTANSDIIEMALTVSQEIISNLDHRQQQAYGSLLLQRLPETTRNLVITRDADFAERSGYKIDNYLTIGADIQLEYGTLFAATKDVFSTNEETLVKDKEGKEVSIGLAEDHSSIIVRWTDSRDNSLPQMVYIPELALLSPKRETRMAVLDTIIDRLGPTGADCRQLLKDIGSRTSTPQEMTAIINEINNSIGTLQARLVQKISRGIKFNAEDVIPQSISYFERFAGPPPYTQEPEFYFKEVLIPYRKGLLSRDLAAGLDICCLGALSDDLTPGQWVSDIDNETLWDALNACHAKSNPFSLLAALDIAMYRLDDPRFRGFAEEAVNQLLDKDFGQQNGIDLYRLLQVTANFILNRVHLLENGHKYRGYWKRIGAWMQAGLVVRAIAESNSKIDIDDFQKWTHDNMFLDGFYAEFVNAWKETSPIMSHTSQSVRDEIFSRLLALKLRHENEGRQLSGSENMELVLDRYREQGISSIVSTSENILGHQPLTEPLPQDLSQKLEVLWTDNMKFFWESLTVHSQFYVLGTLELDHAREAVKTLASNFQDVDKEEILRCLQLAGIVAATSRDTMLADDVLNVLINITPTVSRDELLTILLMMLRTSGALDTQHAWFEWLESGLAAVATRLSRPQNDPLPELLNLLEPIERVFPAESWFHIRARCIASA